MLLHARKARVVDTHLLLIFEIITFSLFSILLIVTYENPNDVTLTPEFSVNPIDTKDKTENHQSHLTAHMSPSSQNERIPITSV